MTIKLHNPTPNREMGETSVCEIKLDATAYFSHTSDIKHSYQKDEADCVVVKKGSTTSEHWPKTIILNWKEL